MGKKVEKGKDKGNSDNKPDDDPSKTPEPYNCTGNIDTDFTELCRRAGMTEIPAVVVRPKPPGVQPVATTESKPGKKGKHVEPEVPVPAVDETDSSGQANGEAAEFVPTTYILRDNYDYMKPIVHVDADPNDKKASVKEIYIRNWKLDVTMMEILKQCIPAIDKLHTIHLRNVGLTDATLEILGNFIPECSNLKNLIVEGTPVPGEEWHRLIQGETNKVWSLSLRNNRITDLGAKNIGMALGVSNKQNQSLVKLNLAFNSITCEGAKSLATGLRLNRTLLVLDLSSNKVGDEGARSLAHVISRFALTHEEVVERRVRMRDQISPERSSGKSPPSSRKADRPGSKGTALGDKKGAAGGKGAGGAAAKGGKSGKDEKGDKGKDDKKADKDKKAGGQDKDAGKGGDKNKKAGNSTPAQADSKSSGAKTNRGGKMTPKGPRGASGGEAENNENYEYRHPLDEEMISKDGELWVKIGNRSLISMNLNRNEISERGAHELLRAMQHQSKVHNNGPKNAPIGLMRLSLAGNEVSSVSETYQHILQMCADKDPLKQPVPPPPSSANNSHKDDDAQSNVGSTGRK